MTAIEKMTSWTWILGLTLLMSCSIQDRNPKADKLSLLSDREISSKAKIIELVWEIANSESTATPEKVFQHLGIKEIPPENPIKPGYAFGSILASDQNSGKERPQLTELGLSSIVYHKLFESEYRRYSIQVTLRLTANKTCISRSDVRKKFGDSYKKMPAAVIAPASVSKESLPGKSPTPDAEVAGMDYGNLFHGNGSAWFVFESADCAESITFNSWMK